MMKMKDGLLFGLSLIVLTACESPAPAVGAATTAAESVSEAPSVEPVATATPTPTVTIPAVVTHAPSITVSDQAGLENEALNFVLEGLDLDFDALSFQCVADCPEGLVIEPATGHVNWTPDFTNAGTYRPTFEVSDGTNTATVQPFITIAPANQTPLATQYPNKTLVVGETIDMWVFGYDPDVEDMVITTNSMLPGMSFTQMSGQYARLIWTPTAGQVGNFAMRIRYTDPAGAYAETYFRIYVVAAPTVNTAPVMAAIPNQTWKQNVTTTFTVSATDANNDALTYSASDLPAGATFNPATRVFSWKPACGTQLRGYTFSFTVSDGLASDSRSVEAYVGYTNCFAPTWSAGALSATHHEPGSTVSEAKVRIDHGMATDADSSPSVYYETIASYYTCNANNYNLRLSKYRNEYTHVIYGKYEPSKAVPTTHIIVAAHDNDFRRIYKRVTVSYNQWTKVWSIGAPLYLESNFTTAGWCPAGTTLYQQEMSLNPL